MVDEKHLSELQFGPTPWGQIVVGQGMRLDYLVPRPTRIDLEGVENIPPGQPVMFALNHTDRYNYWPFQFAMWRRGGLPYTAVWVKAKYYEPAVLGWFFDLCGGIPLPSRGYLILQDARFVLGRYPDAREFGLLHDLAGGTLDADAFRREAGPALARVLDATRRDFDPAREAWVEHLDRWNDRMMGLVEAATLRAFGAGRNVIVFPQGTRSVRLLPCRTGMLQFALRHRVPIVPVGSNGCEKVYPGGSPLAKGGHVVYRIGRPLTLADAFADCRIDEPYRPFTRAADRHREVFQRAAARLTSAIDSLLDPPYRLDPTAAASATDIRRLV